MPMNRAQKDEEIAALKTRFEEGGLVVVTQNNGLTVAEVTELRTKLRAEGASFRVAKNTLLRRAVVGTKFEGLAGLFKGPTGIASSKDPLAAARVTYAFAKDHEKFVIIGGASGAETLSLDTIKTLALLPSLDALRGKIIGILQAPGAQIARVVNAYATKE